MSRRPRRTIECRDYALPPDFPIIVLTGENWLISDIPSGVLHFHNSLEIGYCHKGSGNLEFQDRSCPFKAGDVTMIANGTPHTTYSTAGTTSLWSYLFVDPPALLKTPYSFFSLPSAQIDAEMLYNFHLIIGAQQDPSPGLLVQEILREMTKKEVNYKYAVRGLFDALQFKLLRYISHSDPQVPDSPMLISPALRYIDSHYMNHVTVNDLAAMCKVSVSYFRHVFTETVGMGPLEHLNRTRVIRSCVLLQTTNLSVTEVCDAVGFRSLSSYNRHFSEMMGQSPSAWRHHVHSEQPVDLSRYSGWLVPPKMEASHSFAAAHTGK